MKKFLFVLLGACIILVSVASSVFGATRDNGNRISCPEGSKYDTVQAKCIGSIKIGSLTSIAPVSSCQPNFAKVNGQCLPANVAGCKANAKSYEQDYTWFYLGEGMCAGAASSH